MKNWEMPVVEEISLAKTENGGEPSMNFDNQWFDEKGALVVSFKSES